MRTPLTRLYGMPLGVVHVGMMVIGFFAGLLKKAWSVLFYKIPLYSLFKTLACKLQKLLT